MRTQFEQTVCSQVKNPHVAKLPQDEQKSHYLDAYHDFVAARVDAQFTEEVFVIMK